MKNIRVAEIDAIPKATAVKEQRVHAPRLNVKAKCGHAGNQSRPGKNKKAMKNEYGIDCPLNWEDVDSRIQYIAAHVHGKIIGFCKQPILKDYRIVYKQNGGYFVNFWDCAMDETIIMKLGKYPQLNDVSKHIWQRPQP